ncbi:hypothetical protein D210916BOD24_10850 [Alteromonas sp. D210916BOD_24]|uniref:hypothetical protein n=1 Tax=Alteromonas sp. D210916BOD_24 TaxID=3157618 RepID=UPI00399D38B8
MTNAVKTPEQSLGSQTDTILSTSSKSVTEDTNSFVTIENKQPITRTTDSDSDKQEIRALKFAIEAICEEKLSSVLSARSEGAKLAARNILAKWNVDFSEDYRDALIFAHIVALETAVDLEIQAEEQELS